MIFLENQNNFIQERFLEKIKGKPVDIFLLNGYHTKCKIIYSDNYVMVIRPMHENVLLEVTQLIFKNSISSIVCNEVIDISTKVPISNTQQKKIQQNNKTQQQNKVIKKNEQKPDKSSPQNMNDFEIASKDKKEKIESTIEANNNDFEKTDKKNNENSFNGIEIKTEKEEETSNPLEGFLSEIGVN